MPHDVFISYSSQDKTVADATCAALEAQKLRCWIAPRDVLAGTEWANEIVKAINGCRAMVLVFSANANTSPDIGSEVHLAFSRGIPIVSLRIENVVPEGAMEYRLSKTHWLDALTPPIEMRIGELVESVRRLLARDSTKVPPANKPAPTSAESTLASSETQTEIPAKPSTQKLSARQRQNPMAFGRVVAVDGNAITVRDFDFQKGVPVNLVLHASTETRFGNIRTLSDLNANNDFVFSYVEKDGKRVAITIDECKPGSPVSELGVRKRVFDEQTSK